MQYSLGKGFDVFSGIFGWCRRPRLNVCCDSQCSIYIFKYLQTKNFSSDPEPSRNGPTLKTFIVEVNKLPVLPAFLWIRLYHLHSTIPRYGSFHTWGLCNLSAEITLAAFNASVQKLAEHSPEHTTPELPTTARD